MQSGGEEEQDEEAHTPLPPPMEIIIKDPSAQDEKVSWDKGEPGMGGVKLEGGYGRKVSQLISTTVAHPSCLTSDKIQAVFIWDFMLSNWILKWFNYL